tara:strand:+ start:4321 stop:5271 length:951 start_codon:yes stop_codon:yes gene_type:complete
MKAFVTGGMGFLGAHLVSGLLRQGHHVHVFDQGLASTIDNSSPEGCVIVRGDLLDANSIRAAVSAANPDVVFHLAAVVNLDRSLDIADACMRVNVLGTLNLLRALEEHSLESFVLPSSVEVYGNGAIPFSEEQAAAPPSPYAVSKLAAEQLALSLYRSKGFPAVVVRIATAYGPGQPNHRLIPSLIGAFSRGERPALSNPDLSRDFLYVEDVVEGLLLAAECQTGFGEVINLGDEQTHTIKQVAETVRNLMMVDLAPRYGAMPARANEARVWASSNEKARKLLGWTPRTILREGLKKTISWYCSQSTTTSSTVTNQ